MKTLFRSPPIQFSLPSLLHVEALQRYLPVRHRECQQYSELGFIGIPRTPNQFAVRVLTCSYGSLVVLWSSLLVGSPSGPVTMASPGTEAAEPTRAESVGNGFGAHPIPAWDLTCPGRNL